MQLTDIALPAEVSAVRAALWTEARHAGVTIGLFGPGIDKDLRGFTENALVGGFMTTLTCAVPWRSPEDLECSITVSDVTPGVPARVDGLGLLMLHFKGGIWRLHIELSETLFQWNEVYYRLTGGILAQKSMGEIRDPEAVVVAAAVGQFLVERSG